MRGKDLRRVERDLAARRLTDPHAAAARAHRGRALVEAALRGEPIPEPAEELAAARQRPTPRLEITACARCYRPHEAPPGSTCAACADPPPIDLSDLDSGGPGP